MNPIPDALKGVTVQTFRDKIPGTTHAARVASLRGEMRKWKALGAKAVAFHGFTTELPAAMPELVGLAQTVGVGCVAAFGLNSDDPAGKGERIARVANMPGVLASMLDNEAAWEDEAAAAEAAHAKAMGDALRALAPRAVLLHQPWAVPSVHRGFPFVQFAAYCDGWYPQFYYGNWASIYGAARYEVLAPRFDGEWDRLVANTLAPAGYGAIPRMATLQGYHWQDVPFDCVKAVLAQESVFVWAEPYPQQEMLHAIEARQRLDQKVGLYVDGAWAGDTVVRRFQSVYNAKASRRIAVDGSYGPETDAALFGGAVARFFRGVGQALGLAA